MILATSRITGDLHALQAPDKDQAEFEEPEDPTGVSIPQPTALEFDGGLIMPIIREQLLQAMPAARVYQERYETAFQPWGLRAQAPVVGEPLDAYRRPLAVKAKRLLPDGHELRKVNFANYMMMPSTLRAAAYQRLQRSRLPRRQCPSRSNEAS